MALLKDKIVLVTGGTRGIGLGIAKLFAENGASIAFTFLSSVEKANKVEEELRAMGVKAKGYQSDASDYASAEKLVDDIVKDFGDLHVVVNNAGITRDNLLMRMNEQQWDEVMQT